MVIILILAALAGTYFAVAPSDTAFAADSITERSKNTETGPRRTVRFRGEVRKGRRFEKQVRADLFFRLVPEELGWTISIGSKAGSGNFCGVVTSPYRGMNDVYIEGWHFRNSDNSGPNQPGPKNVNAPQQVRQFYFVLNDTDYQTAFAALQVLLWPYTHSKQQIDEAENAHAQLLKGKGSLTIRDLNLTPLELGKQAGIDSMTFDVELIFP